MRELARSVKDTFTGLFGAFFGHKKPERPIPSLDHFDALFAPPMDGNIYIKDDTGLKRLKKDPINPDHYKQGKFETIDIILDRVATLPGEQASLVTNIIRYLWRYDNKNGLEDLEKAQWYLGKLAEVVKDNEKSLYALVGSIRCI